MDAIGHLQHLSIGLENSSQSRVQILVVVNFDLFAY